MDDWMTRSQIQWIVYTVQNDAVERVGHDFGRIMIAEYLPSCQCRSQARQDIENPREYATNSQKNTKSAIGRDQSSACDPAQRDDRAGLHMPDDGAAHRPGACNDEEHGDID